VARFRIPRYRLGFLRYDLNAPIYPQREAFRKTLRAIAQMNQTYGVKGVYQNHSGPEYLSASVWDFYDLIQDLPPAHIGIAYDVLHATVEGGLMWPQTWKLVQPHLGYVSVKDFRWFGNRMEFVPLGSGQVDPAIFKQIRATYRGDYSVHIEHVPQTDLAGNAAALAYDLRTLQRLLAA
jgi:sugar phosphate isomerase/epimerase